MLKFIPFIFSFLIFSLQAQEVKLLEIPISAENNFTYSVNLQKECSFEGVSEISVPSFEQAKKLNFVFDKITYLQRKLNLDIDKKEITPERISFSLVGSTNIFFEFFFKKSDKSPSCNLVKVLHFNNKKYNMDHIKIDYSYALGFPVVEKIIVSNELENENDDLAIYPWQLRGQMSVYELNIGPALNVHTNIRLNNQNKFEKNNPVVQPIPGFFFRYGPLFINKNGMGSLLYHKNDFSILGMGLLEGEPYQGINLRDREQGIFAGTILKYDYVEFTYYNDFLKDKGFNLKLNIAPEFFYRLAWKFSPQAYIQYWDSDYVDYYFGVRPSESAGSGLKTYSGKHTINYGGMLEVMHFVKRWTFVTGVGIKYYGKEVYSSPTVVRQSEVRFIASIMYKVF